MIFPKGFHVCSLILSISVSTAFVVPRWNVANKISSDLAMGLTLYGSQGSRSPLVNWAAYELGLEITMGDLTENPHPFRQIPCLKDDSDVVVFESGAILIYLNSISTKSLTDKQRAAIVSWVAWANASLDPICFLETPEGKVYDTGLKKPNRRIDTLNNILADTDFLVEGEFSVADVAVASYLLYVLQFFPGVDLSRWPNIVKFMTAACSRPGYAKAFGERVQSSLLNALAVMGPSKKRFGMF